jgi:hypothetical protein
LKDRGDAIEGKNPCKETVFTASWQARTWPQLEVELNLASRAWSAGPEM